MPVIALIAKDFREHRVPLFFLTLGSVGIFLLLLLQNKGAAFSMSSLEVVRYALLYIMPLVTLIVGNKLIVNEYLNGTRLFVEALPLGQNLPLVLKYLTGLVYLILLTIVLLLLAVNAASLADEVTRDYLLLIGTKSLLMVWLYWSIVFCFSLCGYLRVILYLLLLGIAMALLFAASVNTDLVPPMALMDEQLFVFERDIKPWFAMVGTALIAVTFTIAGFSLVRFGEGSVIERLSRPMTRRDIVAIAALIFAGSAVWGAVSEKNTVQSFEFTGDHVVRKTDPAVSVVYLDDQYQETATAYAQRISDSLVALQASLGIQSLPDVKLSLRPDDEKYEMDYDASGDVFVSANWLDHDSYDDAVLDSVILHGVMSAQTNGRAIIEPYHWVLDGFTRWWVEQGTQDIIPEHKVELLARALWTLDAEPLTQQLITHWQLTADRFAYPSAEALAWSAMVYLEDTQGREVVLALASEFLTRSIGASVIASVKDRQQSATARVENIIGMPFYDFIRSWLAWLKLQKNDIAVSDFLQQIPALRGQITSEFDADGVHRLSAQYWLRKSELGLSADHLSLSGYCSMKHEYIGPFDMEFEVTEDYEQTASCELETTIHSIDSYYTQGDRVYVALDYEGGVFHQPLRLHAQRLTVQ